MLGWTIGLVELALIIFAVMLLLLPRLSGSLYLKRSGFLTVLTGLAIISALAAVVLIFRAYLFIFILTVVLPLVAITAAIIFLLAWLKPKE